MHDDQLTRIEDRQTTTLRILGQMNETLALVVATLDLVLTAATTPPPKSELGATLAAIAAALGEQANTLANIDETLTDLPDKIAEAISGDVSS